MLMIGMLLLLAVVHSCCPNICPYLCRTLEEEGGVDPIHDGRKERVAPRAHSGLPPT